MPLKPGASSPRRHRGGTGLQIILSMRRFSNGGSFTTTTHLLPLIVITSPTSAVSWSAKVTFERLGGSSRTIS